MMAIPQLQSCCCGCSLKTGTKIIGWLNMVIAILMVITCATSLASFYYLESHPELNTPEAEEIRKHLPALKVLAMFLITVNVVNSVLGFILLMGAYQSKANLVLIWVVVSLTTAVISAMITIIQMLTVYQGEHVMNLISFCIDLYFVLVVYSFYREIRNMSTNYA